MRLSILLTLLLLSVSLSFALGQLTCFGQTGTNACNKRGTCTGTDQCTCSKGSSGDQCQFYQCFSIDSNSSSVCSGSGNCTGIDTCSCSSGNTGSSCQLALCYGLQSDDKAVCSGHGTCSSPNTCSCFSGYINAQCDSFTCSELNSCSGHGTCVGPNQCSCQAGWYGFACETQTLVPATSIVAYFPFDYVNSTLSALGLTPELVSNQYGLLTNSTIVSGGATRCKQELSLTNYQADMVYDRSLTLASPFTVELKFRQLTTTTGQQVLLWMYDREPSLVVRTSSSNAQLEIRYKGITTLTIAKNFRDGNYHTLVIRRTSETGFDFSIDGLYTQSTTVNSMDGIAFGNKTFYSLIIGRDTLYGSSYSGSVDELKIWKSTNGLSTSCTNCSAQGCINGLCVGKDQCACKAGYGGANCASPICNSVLATDSSVCSGHGNCVAPDTCLCKSGYYGSSCKDFTCFQISPSSPTVCSSRGNCTAPDTCSCPSGWSGVNCQSPICYSKIASDPLVCSGQGNCIAPDNCACKIGYKNSDCSARDVSLTYCFGNASTSAYTCSGHGQCKATDTCSCSTGWYDLACQTPSCFGISATSPSVCSGKGICTSVDTCQCTGGFQGQTCSFTQCYSVSSLDTSKVCSGRGRCVGFDSCLCNPGYTGDCSVPICFGYPATDSRVCSGSGSCTGPNSCSCNTNRQGTNCELFTCSGIPNTASNVCSGRGTCTTTDVCQCPTGFKGTQCEIPVCFNTTGTDPNVCSGHGSCSSPDTCVCNGNYGGAKCDQCKPDYMGSTCTTPTCSAEVTCNNHGVCDANKKCVCNGNWATPYCSSCLPNYYGPTCTALCTASGTCNGNGVCSSNGNCTCSNDPINGYWAGTNCLTCKPGYYGAKCNIGVSKVFFNNNGRLEADLSYPGSINPITCSILFGTNAVSLFGTNALCWWPEVMKNPTRFEIVLDSSATVAPGTALTFNFDGSALSLVVQGPTSAPIPMAVIKSPEIVGDCDGITLDGSLSSSPDGRPIKQFKWVATSGYDLKNIQTFLDSKTLSSRVFIPSTLLTTGFTYQFNLTVTSFFSVQSNIAFATTRKVSSALAIATIDGPQTQVVKPNDLVRLVGNVNISSPCMTTLSSTSNLGLTYTWRQVSGPSVALMQQERILILYPGVLPSISTKLVFEYRVYSLVSPDYYSSAQVTLQVSPDLLVAAIAGGDMRSLAVGEDILLDASLSYDPNNIFAPPTYKWRCEMYGTGLSCPSAFTNIPTTQNVKLATTGVPAGKYKFILTYLKADRSSTASTVIELQSTDPISVSFIGTFPKYVNPGVPLSALVSLSSNVISSKAITTWELTNIGSNVTVPVTVSSTSVNIGPSALQWGQSYVLRSQVSTATGTGYAQLSFTVNSPPLSGTVTVDPQIGDEISTFFTISVSGWIDTNTPLTYTYMYYDSNRRIMVTLATTTSNTLITQLPVGNSLNGNNLKLSVLITNSLGASTLFDTSVVVRPITDISALVSMAMNLNNPNIAASIKGDPIAVARFVALIMGPIFRLSGKRALPATRQSSSSTVTAVTNLVDLLVSTGLSAASYGQPGTNSYLSLQSDAIAKSSQNPSFLTSASASKLTNYISLLMRSATFDNATIDLITSDTANVVCSSLSNLFVSGDYTQKDQLISLSNSAKDFTQAISKRLPVGAPAQAVSCANLQMYSQRDVASRFDGKNLTLGSNVNVVFPVTLSKDVNFVSASAQVSNFRQNPYMWHSSYRQLNITNSTVVSIRLVQDENELKVSNLSQPIHFIVPVSYELSKINTDCQVAGIYPVCRYWSDNNGWVADSSCKVVNVTSTTVSCACNHLTDFVATLDYLLPSQSLVDPVDPMIKYKYLNYNPTTTVFSGVGIIGYIIFMIGFYFYDQRHKIYLTEQGEKNEHLLNIGIFRTIVEAIKKYHIYLSLFFKPVTERDRFPRTQRITVVFVILFTFMTTNAIILGTNPTIDTQPALLIVTAIFSNCVVLPIVAALFYCFRNTKAKSENQPIRTVPQSTFDTDFEIEDVKMRTTEDIVNAPKTVVESEQSNSIPNQTPTKREINLDLFGGENGDNSASALQPAPPKKKNNKKNKKERGGKSKPYAPILPSEPLNIGPQPSQPANSVIRVANQAAFDNADFEMEDIAESTPAPIPAPRLEEENTNQQTVEPISSGDNHLRKPIDDNDDYDDDDDEYDDDDDDDDDDNSEDLGNDDDVLPKPAFASQLDIKSQGPSMKSATTSPQKNTSPSKPTVDAKEKPNLNHSDVINNKKDADRHFRRTLREERTRELFRVAAAVEKKPRFTTSEKLAGVLDHADDTFDAFKLEGNTRIVVAILATILFYVLLFVVAGGLVALFHNTMQRWWQPWFTTLFMMLAGVIAVAMFEYVYLTIKFEKWRMERRWRTTIPEIIILVFLGLLILLAIILTLAVAGGATWSKPAENNIPIVTGHVLSATACEILVFLSFIVTLILVLRKPSVIDSASSSTYDKPWIAHWMPYVVYPLVWIFLIGCTFMTIWFGVWMTPAAGGIWIGAFILSIVFDLLFTKFATSVVMGFFLKMHFVAVEAIFYRTNKPKPVAATTVEQKPKPTPAQPATQSSAQLVPEPV